jgi:Icc-related predicted phosphoesterase
MKIDCISDLHGAHDEIDLPGGDLLLIAGDLTSNDSSPAWIDFYAWLEKQDYRKIIYIAGNHDNLLLDTIPTKEALELLNGDENCPDDRIEYLCDSGTEFEGLKIWGSPWSLTFKGINPHCMAFTGRECDLREQFELIPKDTDILITHSPPLGIMDDVIDWHIGKFSAGSSSLRRLFYGGKLKPRLHVFGHIHEGYGHIAKMLDFSGVQFVNASIMNKNYEPVNKPIRIEL